MRAKNVILEFIWGLVRVLTDPVVFLSFAAPLSVAVALNLVRGTWNDGAGEKETLELLANRRLAGVVDYILQFYSAMLAWFLLMFKIGNGIIEGRIVVEKSNVSSALVALGMAILFLWGVYTFFLGGAADPGLLQAYVSQGKPLGHLHFPLFTRLLVIRAATGIVGLVLFYVIPVESHPEAVKEASGLKPGTETE